MKYRFVSYWKYGFWLRLEDGTSITNVEQNDSDIYRLSIEAEGEATPTEDGKWLVDGYQFRKSS